MNEELQARLRRLGVAKGTRHLKPSVTPPAPPWAMAEPAVAVPTDPDEPQSLDTLLPGGRLGETAEGATFILDHVYPLTFRHGFDYLQDLLELTPAPAAVFCRDQRLDGLDFRDFLFLDTETTGLAGAGTLAFMVGVAFFEQNAAGEVLVVRQYFLRDHGDEPAMLLLLDELLASRAGLITFNGRSFDLPLLDNRYLMNRLRGVLSERPHIDLLPPSRRLWRARLGSCALSALEQKLLGLRRSQEDVPGWLIPGLYHDYLRTGDARELTRVFYHNQIDMLSMVTLASRIMRQFAFAQPDDHPIDLLSLGKWQLDLGLVEQGEQTLRLAATGDLPLEYYHQALHRLGALLKQNGRRDEALQLWQQIAATSFDDVEAHLELAKHYEWQHADFAEAMVWTRRALALVDSWSSDTRRAAIVRADLERRLTRLQRKLQHRAG